MKSYLKIKIVSLAAEASLIKSEERRIKRSHAKWRARAADRAGTPPPAVWWGLRDHRLSLRPSARAAGLAYGFLRGRTYAQMEGPTTRSSPDWAMVESNVKRFSIDDSREVMQRFAAWKDEALGKTPASTAIAAE